MSMFFKSDLEKASARLRDAEGFAQRCGKAKLDADTLAAQCKAACDQTTTERGAVQLIAKAQVTANRARETQEDLTAALASVETARQAVSDVQDAIAAKQLLAEIDSAKRTASLEDLHSRSSGAADRVRALSSEIQKELATIYGEFEKSKQAGDFLRAHGVGVAPLNDRHKFTSLALAFLEGAPDINTAVADLQKASPIAAENLKAIHSNSWVQSVADLTRFLHRSDLSRDSANQEKQRAGNRQRFNELKDFVRSNPIPKGAHPSARSELQSQIDFLLADPLHASESAVNAFLTNWTVKADPRYGQIAGVVEFSASAQ